MFIANELFKCACSFDMNKKQNKINCLESASMLLLNFIQHGGS